MGVLAMIQAAALAAETAKNLIDKFTTDDNGAPLPPETEVLPGITVAEIQTAAAKGREAAARLKTTAQGVLDRLDAEEAGRANG